MNSKHRDGHWQHLRERVRKGNHTKEVRRIMSIYAGMIMQEKAQNHVMSKKEFRERLQEDLRRNGATKKES